MTMRSDGMCRAEDAAATRAERAVEAAAALLRGRFRRTQARRHAVDYLRGLVADVERKNGWQLAERMGYRHPRGIQRVLDRYAWDADLVRDDLRAYVVAALGDAQGVLVVDETGFPKQGRHSVGVARQSCGTLGKRGNCQIGVFLGYASPKGHAGLDRALYLPREWTEDEERCRAVGVPPDTAFQTKPQLAIALVERALDAGVPAAWVAGDEVDGGDSTFRAPLEDRGQAYVLAVRRNQPISTWPPYGPPNLWTVAEYAATIPAGAWRRLSCGDGAQGPRLDDWAYRSARPATRGPTTDGQPWVHGLLVRRHPERPDELAYYLVYAPMATPLQEMARAAGARWTIDAMFKLAKGQVGLDHYEVRSWQGWYRHITLALLAFAALTIAARQKGGPTTPLARSTSPSPSRKCAAPDPLPLGRHPSPARSGGRRRLVPLAPPPPENRPGVPPSAPPETATAERGTVILETVCLTTDRG